MGSRLRQLRGNRTLAEIGRLIGVTPSAIQRYENGRVPRAEVLHRLAKTFSVSIEDLLQTEPQFLIMEAPIPYGGLDLKDEKVVRDLLKLLQEGGDKARRDIRRQIDIQRRALQAPKKRVSGED